MNPRTTIFPFVSVAIILFLSLTNAGRLQSAHAASTGCAPPPSGLVSWWPGDGNTNDIVGGHTGTLRNGATFGPGEVGQAFTFNGISQFLSVDNSAVWDFGSNPFTITLWVRFNQSPGHDAFISHDEGPGNSNKWFLGMNPFTTDTNTLAFHINGVTGPISVVNTPWVPSVNQWYHVAVTRAAATYSLYIDGALVATSTDTNSVPAAATPLTIGEAEGSFFHNGLMDEVQILNRAITLTEVQSIFDAGTAGNCKPVLVDNFNDNMINPATWTVSSVGTGPTISAVNQRLEITIPAASSQSNDPDFGIGLTSTCKVRGDFDLQVDYQLLTWPSGNGVRVAIGGLGAVNSANGPLDVGDVQRRSNGPNDNLPMGEMYVTDFPDGRIGVSTADLSGTLREVRSGSALTGYYLSGSDWVPIHSITAGTHDTALFIGAWSWDAIFSHQDIKVGFDNLVMNQGQLICPASWTQLHPSNSPSPRDFASTAYDAADGYTVLFGGYGGSGETWSFANGAWSQLSPTTSPPQRAESAMAYDAADGEVVLFGGWVGGSPVGDTWTFKGGTWTQLSPTTSPPARFDPAIVYDPADGYVLLFSGSPSNTCTTSACLLTDTWKFQGGVWTQLSPTVSPPARDDASIAYDAADGYVIMFGGASGSVLLNDNWEFKGGSWTQLAPSTSPSPRDGAAMTYDSTDGYVLLFAGYDGANSLGDTWKFQAGSWTQLSLIASPPSRFYVHNSMTFDGTDGYVLLFGGISGVGGSVLGDSWRYGPATLVSSRTDVVCDPPIVVINQETTCTATVTDTSTTSATTPTGTVVFTVTGSPTPLATCTLSGAGASATCTVTGASAIGGVTASITATYSGDSIHATSSGTTNVTINLRVTSTTVSCSPSTIVINQGSTCTITVTDTSPGDAVTPTMNVLTTPSSSCSLSGSGATATCTIDITGITGGPLSVTANYQGDTSHNPSRGATTITITLRSTSLSVTCTPSTVIVGQTTNCTFTVTDTSPGAVLTPTGAISTTPAQPCNLSGTGASSTCAISLTFPVATVATISGTYGGDSPHTGDSASATVTVNLRPTTTSVQCSPSSVNLGSATTCAATVYDSSGIGNTVTPTGFVQFVSSGTGAFATTPCNAAGASNGIANCSVQYTPSGSNARTDTITATFCQSSNCGSDPFPVFYTSSGTTTVTVASPIHSDFKITANPTMIILSPEDSENCRGGHDSGPCDDEGTTTITVTFQNGFTGQVTLTVSSMPHIDTELSKTIVNTSGTAMLEIGEGSPGNYTITITGTSGSLVHSATVTVNVRQPEKLKCGHGDKDDCRIESDAPLTNTSFSGHTIHFTMTGEAGTTGAANVTIPRSAIPDINRIKIFIDHNQLSSSDVTITSDDNNYHVYFKVTFHSPVDVDIDLNPTTTILGLDPLILYSLAGVLVVVLSGMAGLAIRASRKPKSRN